MRIGLLGVGAIGGVIGGYLARAGEEVTLVDTWPENIERIKSNGLKVTSVEEEFITFPVALHIGELSATRPKFDVLILSVKSDDTSWAVKFIEPYLAEGGFIVSAQNSINEFRVAEEIGWTRVMGCVVTIGASLYEPGNPCRTSTVSRPAFVLGEPSGMITPRLESMVEVMGPVGITKTTTNLWGQRWAKLGTNCMANALAAVSGLTSFELRNDPVAGEIAVKLVAEVIQVAMSLGVHVEDINGQVPASYLDAVESPGSMKLLREALIEQGRSLGEGRPSLAQDVMKGRKTEIEHLNGYVISKGIELGVSTPVNVALYRIAKELEAGEINPSPKNLKFIDL